MDSDELIKKREEIAKAEEAHKKKLKEAQSMPQGEAKDKFIKEADKTFEDAKEDADRTYEDAKANAFKDLHKLLQDEINKTPGREKLTLKKLEDLGALNIEAKTPKIFHADDKAQECPKEKFGICNPPVVEKNTAQCKPAKENPCKCKCYIYVNVRQVEFRAKGLIDGADNHSCPDVVNRISPGNISLLCRCVREDLKEDK